MSSNNNSDFILLSTLINKLKDNNYYRTFAKSLLRANIEEHNLPSDNELVAEMFRYFIKENELYMFHNSSKVSADYIESEANRRILEKTKEKKDIELMKELEQKLIWEKEIYINIKDLKKLYANKCIVFPKSLLNG